MVWLAAPVGITSTTVNGRTYAINPTLAALNAPVYDVTALLAARWTLFTPFSMGSSALPAPLNLIAYAGNSQVTLSWLPVQNASWYEITTTPATQTWLCLSPNSAVISGLSNGTAYTFSVAAANAVGTSAFATSGSITPTAPPVTLVGGNLLLLWLDANQLTGQTNGVQLTSSTWPDVSGNGNNFVGGSGYSSPAAATCGTYNSSWTNSKPGVNFAQATPNALNCVALTGVYLGGAISVFSAFASNNTDPGGGQQTVWSNGFQQGTNSLGITHDMTISGNYRGAYDFNAQVLLQISQTGTTNVPQVTSCLSPWLKGLYKNGVQTATAGMSAQMGPVTTPFCLGCKPNQSNYNFGGVIGEVLLYKGIVSVADHNTILAYLGTKYNITMTTVTT